ncbi:MAG: hypothetical protein ACHQRJ_03700 [Alphaproteobacteria bacterium]
MPEFPLSQSDIYTPGLQPIAALQVYAAMLQPRDAAARARLLEAMLADMVHRCAYPEEGDSAEAEAFRAAFGEATLGEWFWTAPRLDGELERACVPAARARAGRPARARVARPEREAPPAGVAAGWHLITMLTLRRVQEAQEPPSTLLRADRSRLRIFDGRQGAGKRTALRILKGWLTSEGFACRSNRPLEKNLAQYEPVAHLWAGVLIYERALAQDGKDVAIAHEPGNLPIFLAIAERIRAAAVSYTPARARRPILRDAITWKLGESIPLPAALPEDPVWPMMVDRTNRLFDLFERQHAAPMVSGRRRRAGAAG